MKKSGILIVFIVVLIGLAVYQDFSSRNKEVALPTETAPKPSYRAPAFTLQGLDGLTYEVGGKRDKPLFLNFWASWCGPCELEAPDLKRMYDKYKDQLDMYAVNVTRSDKLDKVEKFAERHEFRFPVLLDREGKASELYKFYFIPTSYLIDRNGVIVEVINLVDSNQLEGKIKALIER
ncbi:TlpA disulfide reductase family protein [Paenibacillus sp. J2TS4]|uniref:TlpA family protein disulfide reductase n=1 Tax=Paenibacillus sp. J2TS4 TaxID=2807194 RepID=UPI001B26BA60|nr:TlpA disulfide reductase family protein [Paenibacillus sp. J2TS4]GIP33908.1 thioredoxin [Paenibacillus sp. J2TS4]